LDGENNGKPYFLMDDLGGKPTFFGNTHRLHVWKYLTETGKPPRPRGFLSFLQLASAKGTGGGSPVEGMEG